MGALCHRASPQVNDNGHPNLLVNEAVLRALQIYLQSTTGPIDSDSNVYKRITAVQLAQRFAPFDGTIHQHTAKHNSSTGIEFQ